MNKKSLLCLVLCLITIPTLGQSFNIQENGYFELQKSGEYFLEIPISMEMSKSGELFLCNSNSIFKFGKDGNLLAKREAYGRGPGEMQVVYDCTLTNDTLVVFDGEKREFLFFDSSDLSYLSSLNSQRIRPSKFEIHNKKIYGIEKNSFGSKNQPILRVMDFSSDETEFSSVESSVAEYAYIGSTRDGGGITKDNNGNIYYSLLSYSKIWGFNTENGAFFEFDAKSDLYVPFDISDVRKMGRDHTKHIAYTFSISRVSNLFHVTVNQEYIVQMVEHGNPWKNEEVSIQLNFVNLNGKLISSNIVEERVAFSNKSNLYTLIDWNKVLSNFDEAKQGDKIKILKKYNIRNEEY